MTIKKRVNQEPRRRPVRRHRLRFETSTRCATTTPQRVGHVVYLDDRRCQGA
jgi:hypothetical protein